ncbi:MAG: YHS domain protein [Chitinophagaceae bacterium BSSC1]|nr:MAG: YHS domain protein [Chitinophagaceae bacterium BSSC1]
MKNILLLVMLLAVKFIYAQKSEIYTKDGKALQGYDVVSFHLKHMPVIGDSSISFKWKEANWYFENETNLKLFKENPEKYAPQFGGYCAYGCSDGNGHKAPTKIETWTIVNDKLYFNYNLKVQEIWNKNQASNIEKAVKNWAIIKDKE